MVEVTMTMEEYLTLINGLSGNDMMPAPAAASEPEPQPKKRKKTKRDRAMKIAVREANARYRKRNGQFRAGRSQADVMRLANKLADRMMK